MVLRKKVAFQRIGSQVWYYLSTKGNGVWILRQKTKFQVRSWENKCLAVAKMGDHLATTNTDRKLGAVPLGGGEAESPSNTMSPGPRPTSLPSGILIHPAVWPQQTWSSGYTDASKACAHKFRSVGALCPFPWGEPSNTMWHGLRPTCMPSFILIHPTVWPQYTNVTDKKTDRQRSDRIGRTFLQTVAQKLGIDDI